MIITLTVMIKNDVLPQQSGVPDGIRELQSMFLVKPKKSKRDGSLEREDPRGHALSPVCNLMSILNVALLSSVLVVAHTRLAERLAERLL